MNTEFTCVLTLSEFDSCSCNSWWLHYSKFQIQTWQLQKEDFACSVYYKFIISNGPNRNNQDRLVSLKLFNLSKVFLYFSYFFTFDFNFTKSSNKSGYFLLCCKYYWIWARVFFNILALIHSQILSYRGLIIRTGITCKKIP